MRRVRCGACALACALAVLVAGVPARAAAPRAFVILVDTSTSMDDIMPLVHEALANLAADLRPGDRCAVLAFGDRVRRVVDRTIATEADAAALQSALATLQPTDRFTDITSAVERGLAALRQMDREDPHRVPILLLLTDGRHNPAPNTDAPSFAALAELYPDFVGGTDWFLHYVVLRDDVADENALQFTGEMEGAFSRAEDGDALRDALHSMPVPVPGTVADVTGLCTVGPVGGGDRTAAVPGTSVPVGFIVQTDATGRAVVRVQDRVSVGVGLGTQLELIESTWDLLQEAGDLVLRVHQGTCEVATEQGSAVWRVAMETPAGRITLQGTRVHIAVDETSGSTVVGVRRGAVRVQDVAGTDARRVDAGSQVVLDSTGRLGTTTGLARSVRAHSEAWDAALTGDRSLRAAGARLAAAAWEGLSARLGPMAPGLVKETELSVALVGVPPETADSLRAEARGSLPQGLAITADLFAADVFGRFTVAVRAEAGAKFHSPAPAEYAVEVALVDGAAQTLATFPAVVWAKAEERPRAATTDLPRAAEESGWEVVLGFASVGVLLLVFVFYRGGVRGERVLGAAPLGRLLVVENPVPHEWNVDFIRLDEWLKKRGRARVSIGRSQYCDLRLPHTSVEEHHGNLHVWRGRRDAGAQIESVKGAPIEVNQEVLGDRAAVLQDRMQVALGAFVFQYEDSAAKPQVLVHMTTGQTVRGALHSWDIHAPRFTVAPDDPDVTLPGGPIHTVPFTDVQDIAMLRLPGQKPPKRRSASAGQVVIRFPGGRELRGALWADYTPDAPRFALFPEDHPDVDYVVVVRANAEAVTRDGVDESDLGLA